MRSQDFAAPRTYCQPCDETLKANLLIGSLRFRVERGRPASFSTHKF